MARRLSESSNDSWSLVERRSSVESSDDEEGEIVMRHVVENGEEDGPEFDDDNLYTDSCDSASDSELSNDDSDIEETTREVIEEETEEEEEDEDEDEEEEEQENEVEEIDEEEGKSDSAARHYVPAHKIADSLDVLADGSPVQDALINATNTPQRYCFLLTMSVFSTIGISIFLEFLCYSTLGLVPQSVDLRGSGLQRQTYGNAYTVDQVREFMERRQIVFPRVETLLPPLIVPTPPHVESSSPPQPVPETAQFCRIPFNFSTQTPSNPTRPSALALRARLPLSRAPRPYPRRPLPRILPGPAPVPAPAAVPARNATKQPMCNVKSSTEYLNRLHLISRGPIRPAYVRPLPSLKSWKLTTHIPLEKTTTAPHVKEGKMRPCEQYERPCNPAVRPCESPKYPHPCTVSTPPLVTPLKSQGISKPKPSSAPTVYKTYSLSKLPKQPQPQSFRPKPRLSRPQPSPVHRPLIPPVPKRQSTLVRPVPKPTVRKPSIYANSSRSIMRKNSFSAGHCDRRMIKQKSPTPCVSYKEELPCIAPPPKRVLPSKKATKPVSKKESTTKPSRPLPKKEYIKRIPLV